MPAPTTCVKCASAKVMPEVLVRDLGDYNAPNTPAVMVLENPDAFIFKETFVDGLKAVMCGECGYAELYVTQPRELYAAYERSKQPRD